MSFMSHAPSVTGARHLSRASGRVFFVFLLDALLGCAIAFMGLRTGLSIPILGEDVPLSTYALIATVAIPVLLGFFYKPAMHGYVAVWLIFAIFGFLF